LLSRVGPAARIFSLAREGKFRLVTAPAILREVRIGFFKQHIRRRYPLPLEEIADYLAALQLNADVVAGDLEVDRVTDDPKDHPILACAVEGDARYVVTDDRRDLLPIKHWRRIQIVSAPAFLRMLASR
jgi:putative PIN family toxin of toxin-antitoxin system